MTDADVAYNPFADGFIDNPYTQYAALRAHDPVHRTAIGGVYLSRYDDVFAVLRNSRLSVEAANGTESPLDVIWREAMGPDALDTRQDRTLSMLDRDPPDHDRLRKLVSRAFTPRRVAELRPRIEQLVDTPLDEAGTVGGMDAIGALAFPLPFQVISDMLGMPETDMETIRELSGTLVRSLEPVMDPDVIRAIAAASEQFGVILDDVIEWKKANPGDDLLTLMIEARLEEDDPGFAAGDRLTDEELSAQLGLLFIAGHETTVNLIGNGLAALIRNPDQQKLLREEPDRITNAVEEFLRYDPPVQNTRRIPLDDIEVRGTIVEKGSFLICGLASANRDEAHFGADADTLDITREKAHDHLAFGGGVHYCLGANLAKLEAQVAISSLVSRFEKIDFAGPLEMNGRINLRGLDKLPISLA